ncbi:MAG: FeoA family protein [Spirochaetota bacterium]|nr:FeoA family protein [Spirochaetota bacterium]
MLQDEGLSISDGYAIFQEKEVNSMHTPLSLCGEGDRVLIHRILGNGGFRKRLIEMGIRKGKELTIVRYAPLRDPMEISIDGCHVSLRVEEAEKIDVEKIQNRSNE